MATDWTHTRTTGVAIARWVCRIMGIAFLLVALMGFISGDDMVLGMFMVNTAHNIVHLLSGALLLAMGFATERAAQATLWIFAALYGLVTILGFAGFQPLVDALHVNNADNWLHLLITLVTAGAAAASAAQLKSVGVTRTTTTTPSGPLH